MFQIQQKNPFSVSIIMQKLFSLLLILSIILCSCEPEKDSFRIAAAANMRFAMEEITAEFQRISGNECELITASSGKLTAQIINGAPYDIFLSADSKYPERLYNDGKAVAPPRTYAFGQLVLWTASDTPFDSYTILDSDYIQYIAMANPETAPYGRATREMLEKVDYWDEIEDKLVFGESVGQTTQFIETGTANIGFTSKSMVMAPRFQSKGHWIQIPDSLHKTIEQQFIIIANDNQKVEIARDFVSFLDSDTAKSILEKYGYKLP